MPGQQRDTLLSFARAQAQLDAMRLKVLAEADRSGATDTEAAASAADWLAVQTACTAGIIPAVLGGKSEVLDLGRRSRLHSPAQRLAMTLRDRGCTAAGCDRPPAMCHAHHDEPWSHGGATSVDNGRLLCGHHHRRIHDPAYQHRVEGSGRVRFHRRT